MLCVKHIILGGIYAGGTSA